MSGQSPSPVERYVSARIAEHVTPQDRTLLAVVFAAQPTQEDLNACLQTCDIEVMGAHKSLVLSYLMHDHPELRFPAYAAPRLKGLISFFRFANMKVLSHFSKIGKALNAAGIPMAIFKGGAMKALRPELSRVMGDVDMLIPPKRMAEAVAICERLGYHDAGKAGLYNVDIQTAENQDAVDIHCSMFIPVRDASAFNAAVFARATERTAFGVSFLLPAHEDLFFILLVNLLKNLREKTSITGLLYSLLDCRFLLADKPGFDWNIVRESAASTDLHVQIALAAAFMDALVPGIIPDRETHLPLTEAVQESCRLLLADEEYFARQHYEDQDSRNRLLRQRARRSRGLDFFLNERTSALSDCVRRHLHDRSLEVSGAH